MKKQLIRTTALTLAVIIMLCPLCVCFAAGEVAVDLAQGFIIDILWDTLKSWGIRIYENATQELTDNVRQWLTGQLAEYIAEEYQQTIEWWITGMQFYRDAWGRLIGNNAYIEAADEFATHLRQAFGLTNNSTQTIGSTHYVDQLTAYVLPVSWSRSDNQYYSEYSVYTSTAPVAALYRSYRSSNKTMYGWFFISNEPATITRYNIDNNGAVTTVSWQLYTPPYTYSGHPIYLYFRADGNTIDGTKLDPNPYIAYDESVIYQVLGQSNVTLSSDGQVVYINTGTIMPASSDPNYSEGYSIIYYPDGTIGYLDINWPETITVDNLPAIVSTGTIANPGIQSVFLPIKSFITTFEDGFGLMTQLVYNLPSEIVGMALAIMAGIIVFGTIKIMKEH